MSKKITEHDALKGIDELLGGLTTEERQWVFDCIVLKYKMQPTANVQTTSGISNLSMSGRPASSNSLNTGSNVTIKDFLVQRKPKDSYEKIACIVYYLEKV